jgi:hypothetical protein
LQGAENRPCLFAARAHARTGRQGDQASDHRGRRPRGPDNIRAKAVKLVNGIHPASAVAAGGIAPRRQVLGSRSSLLRPHSSATLIDNNATTASGSTHQIQSKTNLAFISTKLYQGASPSMLPHVCGLIVLRYRHFRTSWCWIGACIPVPVGGSIMMRVRLSPSTSELRARCARVRARSLPCRACPTVETLIPDHHNPKRRYGFATMANEGWKWPRRWWPICG